MINVRGHRFSIAVAMCICLHVTWVYLILLDPSCLQTTALNAVYVWLGFGSPAWTAFLLSVVSLLAVCGMLTKHPWIVVLLMPQQIVLLVSLVGAIEAIWLQQYADGVRRVFAFIMADQVHSILLALAHTAAIISHWFRLTDR